MERACGWKFKSEDRPKLTSELESHLDTWQPYLDYAAEDLEAIMPKRAWTPGSTSGIDLILDGRVTDDLNDPAALILELLHHSRQLGEEKWNSEGFPVRMAAIQSLNLYFLRQTDEIPLVRLRARQE